MPETGTSCVEAATTRCSKSLAWRLSSRSFAGWPRHHSMPPSCFVAHSRLQRATHSKLFFYSAVVAVSVPSYAAWKALRPAQRSLIGLTVVKQLWLQATISLASWRYGTIGTSNYSSRVGNNGIRYGIPKWQFVREEEVDWTEALPCVSQRSR